MLIYLQMIDTEEERSEFEQIYNLYRNLMYHVAYQILNNSEDAEDALHGAFVRIAKNMDKVPAVKSGKCAAFVVTIVRNIAIDEYRRRKNSTVVELKEEWLTDSKELTAGDELAACILKLPEQQRDVLLLKYHHGYNNDEIAALLGMSRENVKKTLQRAKSRLEKYCMEEGIL